MYEGNKELERVVAAHRHLRRKGNKELQRVLIAHRQLRKRIDPDRPSNRSTSAWLISPVVFAEFHMGLPLAQVLSWSAVRMLQFTLKRLRSGRLSKQRARTILHLARRLDSASSNILRRQLHRRI